MSKPLDVLHEQHRNIARLIDLLEREIGVVENGGNPNVSMLQDIMQYIIRYVDVAHHPLEERLIARFEEAEGQSVGEVEECKKQHEEVISLGQNFNAVVEAVREEQLVERTEFVRAGREYIDFQRKHMDLEEGRVFPTLKRALSDEELQAVGDEVEQSRDPLFGGIVEKEYKQLYDYIIRSA